MKTKGEIEAVICDGLANFWCLHVGHGPTRVRAQLKGDLIVVHLQGVLPSAETGLSSSRTPEDDQDAVKRARMLQLETGRPEIDSVVEQATAVKLSSLHHEIQSATGEEVLRLTLSASPPLRKRKKK